ncbi:MAG: DegT/DnrJ/EryC1/StrS family aminotransferase [Porticoccus sp.]|nr:DegT/DnrJ/EryC1/StrS family aminotransferase [Porticoccus sp.]
MKFIPQIEPWIDSEELDQLREVVESTYISEHKKTDEFLAGVKKVTNSPYALAISNGTLALVACLIAEGVGPGDEVIVPDLTFIATANAVLMVGATPIFCDVLESTGCMDPVFCEKLITNKTKVLMPVHLYGQAADILKFVVIAKKNNLLLIEDAAESFGMFVDGKALGTFGDYGIFSFFANKVITCGEGGVVIANSEENYKKIYRIKNHGRDRRGTFIHEHVGYNFCFTDLQAAIGVSQLGKLERILNAKKKNYDYYIEYLSDIEGLEISTISDLVVSNYWFVNIFVDDPEALSMYMERKGIGTRRFFFPLHRQPCYKNIVSKDYIVSDRLFNRGLSLPSSPMLDDEARNYIISTVKNYFKRKNP